MAKKNSFGTATVYFTSLSTILGAILFLRFDWATGSLGFIGVLFVIFIGHLITIPTALAISEIATNKRVEGGGVYFIISRSFGLNIGSGIGLTLFFSQAISIAFYVIAFTESFFPLFDWLKSEYEVDLPRQVISVPVLGILSLIMLRHGAEIGMKMLYLVVFALGLSLFMFFLGSPTGDDGIPRSFWDDPYFSLDNFSVVFAICFPAFTGMAAGVGMSGDLKNPSRSIPLGTLLATFSGMLIYAFVSYKFHVSASRPELLDRQHFAMVDIALGGVVFFIIGLAASTFSSALGSIMVAPRTLQALANDEVFPSKKLNSRLSRTNEKTGEPKYATVITLLIALIFVLMGDIDAVAQIISMFFIVTYGAICLISFLHHFGAAPSYRPSFRSRWYFSLLGFVMSLVVMFQISIFYATLSLAIMLFINILANHFHKDRQGMEAIFLNALFQLNRKLQVFIQQSRRVRFTWRPSVLCIHPSSWEHDNVFNLVNWIASRHGFGTFILYEKGLFDRQSRQNAQKMKNQMITEMKSVKHNVFIDTLVSPSFTSAIAQAVQLPGVSGMENNMMLLEIPNHDPQVYESILSNYSMLHSEDFDLALLATGSSINPSRDIHIWLSFENIAETHLLILLSYIISGNKSWKHSSIQLFELVMGYDLGEVRRKNLELIQTGRLPITAKNITLVHNTPTLEEGVARYSGKCGLCILGISEEQLLSDNAAYLRKFNFLSNVLFIRSQKNRVLLEE